MEKYIFILLSMCLTDFYHMKSYFISFVKRNGFLKNLYVSLINSYKKGLIKEKTLKSFTSEWYKTRVTRLIFGQKWPNKA